MCNHHEVHEVNKEKNLHTLHVFHGKKNQNLSGCENVITASYHMLYKSTKKCGGIVRKNRKAVDSYGTTFYIFITMDTSSTDPDIPRPDKPAARTRHSLIDISVQPFNYNGVINTMIGYLRSIEEACYEVIS